MVPAAVGATVLTVHCVACTASLQQRPGRLRGHVCQLHGTGAAALTELVTVTVPVITGHTQK
jgi:uncharacterized Zn finger protein (UPF0148 family)